MLAVVLVLLCEDKGSLLTLNSRWILELLRPNHYPWIKGIMGMLAAAVLYQYHAYKKSKLQNIKGQAENTELSEMSEMSNFYDNSVFSA